MGVWSAAYVGYRWRRISHTLEKLFYLCNGSNGEQGGVRGSKREQGEVVKFMNCTKTGCRVDCTDVIRYGLMS